MTFGKKFVAIVDDDEAFLDATAEFLRSVGHETLSFASAEDFLQRAPMGEIACVLTDVNMPGMSGLDLQDVIRTRHPHLHVIVMTALADKMIERRASAGGAACLLRKPILADALLRCIDAAG